MKSHYNLVLGLAIAAGCVLLSLSQMNLWTALDHGQTIRNTTYYYDSGLKKMETDTLHSEIPTTDIFVFKADSVADEMNRRLSHGD